MSNFFKDWKECETGMMACADEKFGGIIDSAIVSGEWFCIFNDDIDAIEGFDTREDAKEAFIAKIRSRNT